MTEQRRIVELTHEECYQTWRALKEYLEIRDAKPDTNYNDIVRESLLGAMGKIQNYLTKDYAGENKGLSLTNSPATTVRPFRPDP